MSTTRTQPDVSGQGRSYGMEIVRRGAIRVWQGTKDLTSNNNDLTRFGGVTPGTKVAQPPRVEGVERSDDYDGIDQYSASTEVADVVNNTTGGMMGWITPETLHDGVVVGGFLSTAPQVIVQFIVLSDGTIRALHRDSNGDRQWIRNTDNVVYAAGDTLHVALVQDGIDPKLYINGVSVAINDIGLPDIDAGAWFDDTVADIDILSVGMARDSTPGAPFNGLIWLPSYFDSAPTQADITAIVQMGIRGV